MRAALSAGLIALGWAGAARSEPLVVGYDRFHAAQPAAAGGRLLYNELGCVNCHGGETGLPTRRGPELTTVTTRLKAEWLRAFIEVHYVPEVKRRKRPESFKPLQDRFGNPASVTPAAPTPTPFDVPRGGAQHPFGGLAGAEKKFGGDHVD